MLVHCDLEYCSPEIDAIFVSHAHFDHINHLKFLDPEIPVYTGYGTKLFIECMEETLVSRVIMVLKNVNDLEQETRSKLAASLLSLYMLTTQSLQHLVS